MSPSSWSEYLTEQDRKIPLSAPSTRPWIPACAGMTKQLTGIVDLLETLIAGAGLINVP